MLVPKTPTDRTSTRGRGVGLGVAVGGADAAAVEGSGLVAGSGLEHAVSAAIDKASSFAATRRWVRPGGMLRYSRTDRAN
jgi:hypothetical protein